MKIYTRSGDEGQTSLIYGRRVAKDSLRVVAYGTVDEANSLLGQALAMLPAQSVYDDLRRFGQRIQRDLFDVGRDLATPEDKRERVYVSQDDVDLLERMIDQLDIELPALTRFILPGGSPAAATLHVARTVVRRAERHMITLQNEESIQPMIRKYLNRLSDLLFVMARAINVREGIDEPGVDFNAEKPNPFADA